MSVSLYLSRPWSSCFEGEDAAADAAVPAPAAAAAAAGDNNANKTFTQDELNRVLAEDRRKHQTKLQEVETKLQKALESKTLTEQDRKALQENLETVQGQLRTKEQQLAVEKKQLEESYQQRIVEVEKKASFFESLFRDSTIERALIDAAVKHEAWSPSQVVTQLRGQTELVPDVDPTTGKPTGTFTPMVKMMDKDATTGEMVKCSRTPDEAVKRMKDMPDTWGNLFRSGVVSGIGAGTATGGLMPGQGKIDVRKLTHAQYLEIRAKNPELLGLARKGR
jgi:hypothetical protein